MISLKAELCENVILCGNKIYESQEALFLIVDT